VNQLLSDHTIHKVREFHTAFDHPINLLPSVPAPLMRLLRFRLIFEEAMEFGRAVGVRGLCSIPQASFEALVNEACSTFEIDPEAKVDLPEAADALGDLDYVVQGANLVFGFPAVEVLDEIHRANMSKLGEDGKPLRRDDGKILKGPNYTPPDVLKVLQEYCRN